MLVRNFLNKFIQVICAVLGLMGCAHARDVYLPFPENTPFPEKIQVGSVVGSPVTVQTSGLPGATSQIDVQGVYATRTGITVTGPDGLQVPVDSIGSGTGVGVAIAMRGNDTGDWGSWSAVTGADHAWGNSTGKTFSIEFWAELVQISQASPGDVIVSNADYQLSFPGLFTVYLKGHTKIPVPTCQILKTNVTVPMGNNISLSTFKKVGDTSPQQTLQLQMTCPAAIPKLQYRFAPIDGSADLGNGTMSLSNAGGASGVGVQITSWQSQDPVPLNQSIPMSWYHGQDGEIDPAWSVRYIQTGDHAKGGKADAKATFTLSYQ